MATSSSKPKLGHYPAPPDVDGSMVLGRGRARGAPRGYHTMVHVYGAVAPLTGRIHEHLGSEVGQEECAQSMTAKGPPKFAICKRVMPV
jgi:hypothetical protein